MLNITFLTKITVKNISISILVILLLINVFRYVVESITKLEMLGGPTTNWLNLLIFLCLFCIVHFGKFRRPIIANCIITFLLIIYFSWLMMNNKQEYMFEAPNGRNALIIQQNTGYDGGMAFFKRKYVIFRELISNQHISYGYGVKPITNNEYTLYWASDDEVTFRLKDNVKYEVYISSGEKSFTNMIALIDNEAIIYNENLSVFELKFDLN